MSGARVLVVDDDPAILRAVRRDLSGRGYNVREAGSGTEALAVARDFQPEVILLDLVLPDISGIDVCRQYRRESLCHIILLSAVGDDRKKVEALEEGADDYVTKPFNMRELEARIRVGLRRQANLAASTVLETPELRLDVASHVTTVSGEVIHLTPKEFELLRLLLENQGRVLTQRHILARVWGPAYANESHILRTFIHQLRNKIAAVNPLAARCIVTDPGIGYRLDVNP